MAFRTPSRAVAPAAPAPATAAAAPGPTGGPARAAVDPRVVAAAGAASISLTAVFTKLADSSTATVVFYRCLLAIVPLAFLAYAEIRRNGTPTRRTVALHTLGGIFLGLDFALWTQSIAMVGAGIATILNNVQVLVVPLLAWAFFRDRIPLRFVAAVPVMFVGIALAGGVLGGESGTGSDPLAGTVLGLLSGVAYAGYIIIIGRTGTEPGGGPNSQVFVTTIAAGVVGTAFGTAWGGIDLTPGWGAVGWLAALALVGQVLGWVLLGASLPKLPSQIGASMLLLQPALAVVFAMLLLGERPTAAQLLGCVVVIAAVSVVALQPRRGAGRGAERARVAVDMPPGDPGPSALIAESGGDGDPAPAGYGPRRRRLRGRRASGIRPMEVIEAEPAHK